MQLLQSVALHLHWWQERPSGEERQQALKGEWGFAGPPCVQAGGARSAWLGCMPSMGAAGKGWSWAQKVLPGEHLETNEAPGGMSRGRGLRCHQPCSLPPGLVGSLVSAWWGLSVFGRAGVY